jgi:RNA-splicing ligase RtcB
MFPSLPEDLCYLTGKYKDDYLHDMKICQEFAVKNREVMARIIVDNLGVNIVDGFETTHNYINFDDNILRKGAISARLGEKVIIPINMRDGALICVGKGNPAWNYSAPHGAGRLMSRNQARQQLTMEEYQKSMDGIYTTSVDESTLDEAAMAYKPMQQIIDNIGDTVDIVAIVRPIYNFKASE